MLRSPFRRARPTEEAVAAAQGASLPEGMAASIRTALAADAPVSARVAALGRLEHVRATHADAVARAIVPAMSGPPDVAARAHLALLVLAPRLALARTEDGGFVASAHPIDAAQDHGAGPVDPALGRVAGLDALATLFSPGEDPPLFLLAPPADAPAPYRPPAEVLARRAQEQQRMEARAQRRLQLHALGLDEDDLEDDAEERLRFARRHIPRRDASVLVEVTAQTPLVLETASARVPLGVAQAGSWWSDVRQGDHKGSQRLLVRLARDEAAPQVRVRRVPTLSAPGGMVALVFGRERVEQVVGAHSLVVFVELEDDALVGVSLTWSTRRGTRLRPS